MTTPLVSKQPIVPVYRKESAKHFVPIGEAKLRTVDLGGAVVQTAPLLFGRKISLLGISYVEAMLTNGKHGYTDIVDADLRLDALCFWVPDSDQYIRVGIPTKGVKPFTTCGPYTRTFKLNFNTLLNFKVNKDTKDIGDAPLKIDLVGANGKPASELEFSVKLKITGEVNLETSTCEVHMADVGDLVTIDASDTREMDQALYAHKFILMGYELAANRCDYNRKSVPA